MGLDIRMPIGLMFTVIGALLTLFGAIGDKTIYQRSLGVNVNLLWGVVLLIAGILFLVFASRRKTTGRA
jgi:multisubunit Na+/H+ antiporter MnhG subunit